MGGFFLGWRKASPSYGLRPFLSLYSGTPKERDDRFRFGKGYGFAR
jgi:hypothetical protein